MVAVFTSQTEDNMATDMETLVMCALCNRSSVSSDLKMLPCFFSGCTDCLKGHLQGVKQGDMFQCPGCKCSHCMPKGGVDGFDDNFISTIMKFISDVLSNTLPKCKACQAVGEDSACSTFCLSCQLHLCQNDGKRHRAMTSHEVFSHSELSTYSIIPKLLSSHRDKCEDYEIHEEPRQYEHYCAQCQTVCCGHCLTYKHEGHEKMPLKRAREKVAEELKVNVQKVRERKIDRSEAQLKAFRENLAKMKQNKETTAQEIKTFGEEVKNMVDKIVGETLENLDTEAKKEEKKYLKAINETIGHTSAIAERHVSAFLEHSSHVNVLRKFGMYKSNLEKCLEHVAETEIIKPRSFPFHHHTLFEVEKVLPRMFRGRELGDADDENEVCDEEIFDCIAFDNEENDIIAIKRDFARIFGMDRKEKGHFQCQGLVKACCAVVHDRLIYLVDIDKREVVVFDRNGNRKRSIKFPQKKSPGNDKFGLSVNPVNGNWYISSRDSQTVYRLTTDSTQLQPFITKGLKNPCHLCVVPNKGLVVSNYDSNKVHMYSFEGTLLWKYGSKGKGDEQFQYPTGVCTDHLNNIFVGDRFNDRLHYVSADGKCLKYITLEDCPDNLHIKNNKLIVECTKFEQHQSVVIHQL